MVDLTEHCSVPGPQEQGLNHGNQITTKSKRRKRKRGGRKRNKHKSRAPPFLPPEAEEGNIEYKLKLVNPSPYRFEHLATQLKWRLQEGRGEAVYQIGVEDNGLLVGLSPGDMNASLQTLSRMAHKVGADIALLREREVDFDSDQNVSRKIAEVLVRKVPDDQQFLDLRVAVLGNVDSGKSTLLGVLTQGELDNGRGRARLNLFRHLHEIQSGRTSSISFEILGFNSKGQVVNYSESRTAEEICESSSKMITFMDLAGHHKYLKTTIFGLTSYCPDFALLVVSASTGIAGTTREHLGLSMALKVPVFIAVSKVDLVSRGAVDRTVRQLQRLLKQPGCNKVPLVISNRDDAVMGAQQFSHGTSVTPIFTISSVSGQSLDLLKVFLNVLPPLSNSKEQEELMQQLTEFQVDEIYSVPDVGTVVGGTLYSGVCREGERLLVGPTEQGQFLRLRVGSIQRNRSACRVLRAGQAATLALGNFDRSLLRKGMVMVSPKMNPTICCEFEAAIVLLFHAKTFRRGFQVTVHVGNVRQTATVECLQGKEELRTGERAVVRFRFLKHSEYLRVGAKLLFREGVTKGIGHVTRLLPRPDQNLDQNLDQDQRQNQGQNRNKGQDQDQGQKQGQDQNKDQDQGQVLSKDRKLSLHQDRSKGQNQIHKVKSGQNQNQDQNRHQV
ncbi:GTP-binding protein 2-like [Periophthalmus magnuspinnatus]|uniref:GTP-binding protein 2-like n=1 Tax=Periophthalmus magnuspinnatus TaxID=409849 RepID=UPI00145A7F5D|nr:GTP-binding protein 2-like [Periophthalmus magnuspinnatus]